MTKRRPFGSYDPNVQRSTDDASVSSSIPSVEEALRLRRKKKKSKTLPLSSDGTSLVDSTSKTPRVSNRSKQQLPPRRGTTRQLRRLEHSMASRTKQGTQQGHTKNGTRPFGDTDLNRNDPDPTKEAVDGTSGVKRKERNGDRLVSLKRLKESVDDLKSVVDGSNYNHGVSDKGVDLVAPATRDDTHLTAKTPLRRASVELRRNPNENDVVPRKRLDGSIVDDNLRLQRHSGMSSSKHHQPPVNKSTVLRLPETTTAPLGLENNVEPALRHDPEDAMMDCASDDESLHLSPESVTAPYPAQENDKEYDEGVLKPSIQHSRSTRIAEVESAETEQIDERVARLSTTTHVQGMMSPRHRRTLVNDDVADTASSVSKVARRDKTRPIVTKGMLSRARQSKPDNEDVFEAMLKSGPPRTGRKEESPTSETSMIGTTIGINPLERCESLDGSEVTMLTTDDSLNGSPRDHAKTQDDTRADDETGASHHHDKSPSSSSKKRERRSNKRFREPEESVNEGSQVVYFEHNGVVIPHPPLPSGWIIRMSKSKQRPFYCHPDHGSTWHCPVVLPHEPSGNVVLEPVFRPSVITFPTRQSDDAQDGEDTESEDSEMWSGGRRQTNKNDVKSVSARHSPVSVASTSSMTRSVDSTPEAAAIDVTDDHGSEFREDDDMEQTPSPMRDEELLKGEYGYGSNPSPQIPTNRQSDKASANGFEKHSGLDAANSFESKFEDGFVGSDRSVSSPSPGVARVSLLTEANTEEPSPEVVAELVSTVRLRQSNTNTVAMREDITHNDDDDEGFFHEKNCHGKAKESIGLVAVERDDTFLALLRETQRKNGSSTGVSPKKDNTTALTAIADGVTQEDARVAHGEASKAKPDDDELSSVDTEEINVGNVEFLEPSTDDVDLELDTRVQDDDSELGPENIEGQESPPIALVHGEHSPVVETDSLGMELDSEDTFEHTVAHRRKDTGKSDDVNLHGKHVGFEAEVEDVVFSLDHDDINLSPQAKSLSPIDHINSFDHGGASPLNKPSSPPTSDKDDDLVGVSPLLVNNSASTTEHDGILDNESIQGEEVEAAQRDAHDDQVSVASSFVGTTHVAPTEWRGYSDRILYPPHPLCHLMSLEALIKAARRRAERRKIARQSKKSSRRERRKATATKLVFE